MYRRIVQPCLSFSFSLYIVAAGPNSPTCIEWNFIRPELWHQLSVCVIGWLSHLIILLAPWLGMVGEYAVWFCGIKVWLCSRMSIGRVNLLGALDQILRLLCVYCWTFQFYGMFLHIAWKGFYVMFLSCLWLIGNFYAYIRYNWKLTVCHLCSLCWCVVYC